MAPSVGHFFVYAEDGKEHSSCTATRGMAGSSQTTYMITAAHCLSDPPNGLLADFSVFFGETEDEEYLAQADGFVEDCHFNSRWDPHDILYDYKYDYVACPIHFGEDSNPAPIPGEAFGKVVPHEPVATANIGYPIQPPNNHGDGHEPYFSSCVSAHTDAPHPRRLFNCLASKGHSGGPLLVDQTGQGFELDEMHPATRFIAGIVINEGSMMDNSLEAVELAAGSIAAMDIMQWAGISGGK